MRAFKDSWEMVVSFSACILADIFLNLYICAPLLCLLDLFVYFAYFFCFGLLYFSRLRAPGSVCVCVCLWCVFIFRQLSVRPCSDLAAQAVEEFASDNFLIKANGGGTDTINPFVNMQRSWTHIPPSSRGRRSCVSSHHSWLTYWRTYILTGTNTHTYFFYHSNTNAHI